MTLEASRTPLSLEELPHVGAAVLTMGVFDGVHLGHQRLLDATRVAAAERGATSVALVFDPPPLEVLRPDHAVPHLGSLATNLGRIAAAGIEQALPIRFDEALRRLPADEFIAAIGAAVDLRALVMTTESAFGRDRQGTPEAMRPLGAALGFDLVLAETLIIDDEPVSSTRVRAALSRGDLDGAARLLGRQPTLEGVVVAGDRRGRELGFPTANLAFDYRPALPPMGIYAGRAAAAQRGVAAGHPALVSIGVRPTFHDRGRLLVEVHLLDFDGDLYDALLGVELDARLREERRFESAAALVEQMRDDERRARALLGIGRRAVR